MNRAVFVGVVLLLTACTQAGTIETRKPITADLGRFSTIGVTVTSKTQIAKSELERLEARLAERLASIGRFRTVSAQSVTPDNTRDLTLVVEVLTLPKGGFWDRSFFGEGEVKFGVTLVERSTSQVIGAGVVNGEASRGTLWSSAGGRAVDEAIEKVVEFVARPTETATRAERGRAELTDGQRAVARQLIGTWQGSINFRTRQRDVNRRTLVISSVRSEDNKLVALGDYAITGRESSPVTINVDEEKGALRLSFTTDEGSQIMLALRGNSLTGSFVLRTSDVGNIQLDRVE